MHFLSMTPFQFDQTEHGWRSVDKEGRYLDTAKLILVYIENSGRKITSNPSIQTLYFHAGQEYAAVGQEYCSQAIECFSKSFKDISEWDWYVRGTIAFLQKDIELLQNALRKGAQNPEILKKFIEALNRQDYSYLANY